MEDKFEKQKNCLYCKKEMDAKYRSKKFCSDKCRVYFGREGKVATKEKAVEIIDLNEGSNKIEPKKASGSEKSNYTVDTKKKEASGSDPLSQYEISAIRSRIAILHKEIANPATTIFSSKVYKSVRYQEIAELEEKLSKVL